jgi:hypothetical protein
LRGGECHAAEKLLVWGAAVASLIWFGDVRRWRNATFVDPATAVSKQRPSTLRKPAMTAEEREAHVAEMRRLWQAMTPAQREAHRNMKTCPYSGNTQHGTRSDGRAGGQNPGQGLRPAREPLGT